MYKLIYLCVIIVLALPLDGIKAEENGLVDVSHSQGVPLGGLGCGYSMFGQYGFIRVNFDNWPDKHNYGFDTPEDIWGYTNQPSDSLKAGFGFLLQEGEKSYCLSKTSCLYADKSETFDDVKAQALLPFAFFDFNKKGLDLDIKLRAFTPLIPHNYEDSTTPIQVFDIEIQNQSNNSRTFILSLLNRNTGNIRNNKVVFSDRNGAIGFYMFDGKVTKDHHGVEQKIILNKGEKKNVRVLIAWYYPKVRHVKDDYRYYTSFYKDVNSVLDSGVRKADSWEKQIKEWHHSIQIPDYLKRIMFSSLSSVMTSSILGINKAFYEIETPHNFLNTMDVCCYSSWAYLINWPELERKDMEQYITIIPKDGDLKGYVWHSAVKDKTDYVEEPCYLNRVYRDYLWYNDKKWLREIFPFTKLAVDRVYKADGYDYLINSDHGNQSYDIWKMPGISAFINIAWIYGLHSYEKMSEALGYSSVIGNLSVAEFKTKALNQLDHYLWNESGYYNCFYRTPTANKEGFSNTIFSDQLFGKWMLAIAADANCVLPKEKVASSVKSIYKHNLIVDDKSNFRGWVNGFKPGRNIDKTGAHAYMFWFGAQFNLASLLGMVGDEEASLNVMKSVDFSLHNNHLAAGEWNRILNDDLSATRSTMEPGKDTARFPAYPRYKSSWEYLIRMLGMQMDENSFYLNPFQSIDFSLEKLMLAGTSFSVKVEKKWNKVIINGKEIKGLVSIPRSEKNVVIHFIR